MMSTLTTVHGKQVTYWPVFYFPDLTYRKGVLTTHSIPAVCCKKECKQSPNSLVPEEEEKPYLRPVAEKVIFPLTPLVA